MRMVEVSRSFRCEDSLSPVLPSEVRMAVLRSLWQGQHRHEALWRWVMMGPTGNWDSGNAAFTMPSRSCGSAILAPSLCLPLFRHALVLGRLNRCQNFLRYVAPC